MSILYITEYGALTQLPGDAGQMPDENTKMAEQAITFTATAGQSAALNPGTNYVRLTVDSQANILFGFGTVGSPPNPVAVNSVHQRFAASQTEYKGVPTNGEGSGNNLIVVKISAVACTV